MASLRSRERSGPAPAGEIQLRIDPMHADVDEEITGLHSKIRRLKGVALEIVAEAKFQNDFFGKVVGSEEVKLYGILEGPFVLRAEWALKLKGVKYAYIEEDLQNKSPELLSFNPVHKKVPVVVHHGKPICESTVIVEHVDEMWHDVGQPILPSDPYQKAMARFWAKFAEEKVLVASFDVISKTGDELFKAVEVLKEHLKTLEGCLNGQRFFGGQTIGFVDIIAGWIVLWIPIIEEVFVDIITVIEESNMPLLWAWMHDMLNVDAVHFPPRDKVVHMRGIKEKLRVQN